MLGDNEKMILRLFFERFSKHFSKKEAPKEVWNTYKKEVDGLNKSYSRYIDGIGYSW